MVSQMLYIVQSQAADKTIACRVPPETSRANNLKRHQLRHNRILGNEAPNGGINMKLGTSKRSSSIHNNVMAGPHASAQRRKGCVAEHVTVAENRTRVAYRIWGIGHSFKCWSIDGFRLLIMPSPHP